MTREEAFDEIVELWDEFHDHAFPSNTSSDNAVVVELLDDIARLIKG